MKSKKQIFSWHHWTGLIAGIFILLMSLSGSMLVFSEEIEHAEKPEIHAASTGEDPLSIDASFKIIQQKYPGWEIRLYDLPKRGKPLIYKLRRKEEAREVFAHPQTGKILYTNANANSSLQRNLLLWHYTMFAGAAGKSIVFVIGILFLVSLVTGIIVYRKAIWKTITFKTHYSYVTRRASFSALHRGIGVWALLFNLMIVITGLFLSGPIAWKAVFPAETKKTAIKNDERIGSLDKVISSIQHSYPSFEIHLVRIRANSSQVQVAGRFADDPAWYGKYYSSFLINGDTHTIESKKWMREQPIGQRLLSMAGPLHFGNYGGLWLKIIYCLGGITPALLSISGFVIWKLRGRKSKKRNLK